MRSQARRVHPGQAQASVPANPCTRSRCLWQVRPWWTAEPQESRQLTGQTHPMEITSYAREITRDEYGDPSSSNFIRHLLVRDVSSFDCLRRKAH